MQTQRGFTAVELFGFVFWMAIFGGWVANIVKFIGLINGSVTAMFIARGVGIFAAPLGVVLGYF